MKEDYHPRIDNERCEEMIKGTYVITVEEMTARRETEDGKTEFFIWKSDND